MLVISDINLDYLEWFSVFMKVLTSKEIWWKECCYVSSLWELLLTLKWKKVYMWRIIAAPRDRELKPRNSAPMSPLKNTALLTS